MLSDLLTSLSDSDDAKVDFFLYPESLRSTKRLSPKPSNTQFKALLRFASFFFRNVGYARPGLQFLRNVWSRSRQAAIEAILNSNQADVVIGIGLTPQVLASARCLQIPSIELQHGIVSLRGLDLWFPIEKPDYFFCWSEFEAKLVEQRGIQPLLVPLPDPNLAEQLSGSGLRKRVSAKGQFNRKVKVFAQYGFERSIDGLGLVHSDLTPFLRSQSKAGNHVVVRFHPVSRWWQIRLAQIVLWSKFSNLRFENPRKVSVHESLENCALGVGYSSSVWREAAMHGSTFALASPEALAHAISVGEGSTQGMVVPLSDIVGLDGASLSKLPSWKVGSRSDFKRSIVHIERIVLSKHE